jgi:primosomal protein N''
MDLANQKQVLQKVNGWKIYHLSTQMEDLVSIKLAQTDGKLCKCKTASDTVESYLLTKQ